MEVQTNTDHEYKVNLDVFEGPLDLLLYLIKKDDVDIYDIPIAKITEKYITYIDAWKDLNVNVAGEYLLMAAELIQMKSKMLLPTSEGENEVLEDDPTADLRRRLLEYQRYKEAAENIKGRSVLNRDEYLQLDPERLPSREEVLVQENVFKLLEAFQILIKRMPSDQIQEVTIDRISVNERIFQLIEMIKANQTVPIEALLPKEWSKHNIVITFLALLEMAKLMMIKVFQAGKFQPIYVTGVMESINEQEALKLVEEESDEPKEA
jgi:segregation and condensation protein A